MKILIGCEESQAVCKAFRERGFEAYSCDIQPCSGGHPEWHFEDNIFHILHSTRFSNGLELFIGHPPCTYLANSGVRWLYNKDGSKNFDRWEKMVQAAKFFKALLHTNADYVAIENPIMHKYALEIIGEKPTQIIQPWMFGDGEQKATCLWIKNLPPLQWSDKDTMFQKKTTSEGREQRIWKLPPGPERAKLRSKTFPGIASAMAEQWGNYLLEKADVMKIRTYYNKVCG